MARSRDRGAPTGPRRPCGRVVDRPDGMRTGGPVGAALPVLTLPDRHRLLEGVDAEPRRLERLGPVRRRHDDRDRRLRQLEVADAVQQRDAVDHGPAPARLVGDRGQLGDRLLLVGLVGEARARRRGRRSCRGPRRGTRRPRRCRASWPTRWRLRPAADVGDGDPVAGGGRLHGAMVVKQGSPAPCRPPPRPAAMRPRGRRGSARTPSVHSAPCPRRRPEATTASPSPTTPSSGPPPEPPRPPLGAPERAAARSSRPRTPGAGRPARGVGRSGSARRSPRCSPPCWCSWRSAPSAAATARRCRPRSSPTPATSSTTRWPSGSAQWWRRASSPCRSAASTTKPVGSGVVLKSDRVITAAHLLDRGHRRRGVDDHRRRRSRPRSSGTDPQTDLALLDGHRRRPPAGDARVVVAAARRPDRSSR